MILTKLKTMKIITLCLLLISPALFAQELFKAHLYAPELIFKYQDEINLTPEQKKKIRELYDNSSLTYNHNKWDLDAEMLKLEKILAKDNVDKAEAEKQLEKILGLENEIKMMRLSAMIAIKNELTLQQQKQLDPYKKSMSGGYDIISSVNEDPRVVVRVSGDDADNQPLYIIVNGKIRKEVEEMSQVDPEQIKSIEVIKGASALELYGERGKNGVVIVHLK
jgi:TonB-dependent SusC/RagA subfamily outer membrane receptor